ncbi:TetR/AcrR family transcriptional regulator [Actinokineospora soli]|uniref:TetR/AcrR family transcriptional regulator n=1 Tax=Actinokineospora soli TaxID=1048753 RepID=A0ABW2TT51_9PSEU
MARPPDTAKRAELVAAALDDLATHGLAEFTLRGLATRLGTSARMLVHYFGGRDALLEAVFAEHRRRTTALITTASDAGRAAWAAMTDDAQRGHFVVMFHLLAASLTDPTDSPVAQAAIVAWVDQVTDLLQARGWIGRGRAPTRRSWRPASRASCWTASSPPTTPAATPPPPGCSSCAWGEGYSPCRRTISVIQVGAYGEVQFGGVG